MPNVKKFVLRVNLSKEIGHACIVAYRCHVVANAWSH